MSRIFDFELELKRFRVVCRDEDTNISIFIIAIVEFDSIFKESTSWTEIDDISCKKN